MDFLLQTLAQYSQNERLRNSVGSLFDMDQHPYGWLSLVPPLIAIVLAIVTRKILISLFVSIVVGAMILSYWDDPVTPPPATAFFMIPSEITTPLRDVWNPVAAAVTNAWNDHLWPTLINGDKVSVFLFTCLMGAIVGMVNRAAGMRGLLQLLSPLTGSTRKAQTVTWFSGMLIFFDDYANTLLLGTTFRSLFDKLKISREKLAYIVDSTAAPVAGIAIISTWIAGELQAIDSGLSKVTLTDAVGGQAPVNAFSLFLSSIPYRFYVLWALLFVLLTGLMKRDFGPMLRAERRARGQEDLLPGDGQSGDGGFVMPQELDWAHLQANPKSVSSGMTEAIAVANDPTLAPSKTKARSLNAILPIAVTVCAILYFMYQSGDASLASEQVQASGWDYWRQVFGAADSYASLVWGSLVGFFFTLVWLTPQRVVPGPFLLQAAGSGAAKMVPALMILWLASTLSNMTGNEPTPAYQAELDRAKAVANSMASVPLAADFAEWDTPQKVHEMLLMQGLPDSVVIETMAGSVSDPAVFARQYASRVLDFGATGAFYNRYVKKDGRQVDWDVAIPRNNAGSGQLSDQGEVLDPETARSQLNPFDPNHSTPIPEGDSPEDENPREGAGGGEVPANEVPPAADTDKVNAEPSGAGAGEVKDNSQGRAENAGRQQFSAFYPVALRSLGQDQTPDAEANAGPGVAPQDQDPNQDRNQDQDKDRDPNGAGENQADDSGAGGPPAGGPPAGGPPGGGLPGGGGAGGMAPREELPDYANLWQAQTDGLEFPYTDFRHRLHTGQYLSTLLTRTAGDEIAAGQKHPLLPWLPTIIFVLAGFTAFATGTSWGTMFIIMPLAIPLAGSLMGLDGSSIDGMAPIFLATIGSVLAGAVFGDHCSPISDTTVLSSQASGCDHLAHVWTQMPYALTVGFVTIAFGTIPVGFGLPWYICLPTGTVALVVILLMIGRNPELPVADSDADLS